MRGMPKTTRSFLQADTLAANLPSEANPLLTPEQAATILGLSTKWLAAAREGRKGLEGPPYIKLGQGRTAPVRYKLGSLQQWLSQFEEVVNNEGARPSGFSNFADFAATGLAEDKWLFAMDPDTMECIEFFEAVRSGRFTDKSELRWVTHPNVAAGRLIAKRLNLSTDTYQALAILGEGDLSLGLDLLMGKTADGPHRG
jgi:hypothetical protein